MSIKMMAWLITGALVIPIVIFVGVSTPCSSQKMTDEEKQEQIRDNTLRFGILALWLLLLF